MKSRRPKIFFKRLAKARPGRKGGLYGMVATDGNVYVDPRQSPSEMLDTIVHEMVHVSCPFMPESRVTNMSYKISEALWKKGYRRKP